MSTFTVFKSPTPEYIIMPAELPGHFHLLNTLFHGAKTGVNGEEVGCKMEKGEGVS